MRDEKRGVVVAMSGGVDSSVAAALLVERGFRVTGVTFRVWEEGAATPRGRVRLFSDPEEAARVAGRLGVEHRVIDLRERFTSEVVEPFAREYLRGRTPNPCVECNRRVRFPALMEAIRALDADLIATGHYARMGGEEGESPSLLRASSVGKDQSYVLYGMSREELRHCVFPNGDLAKSEIMEAAAARGFDAAERVESQEICFLHGGNYREFLAVRYPEALSPGPVLDTFGREIGEHRGIAFYTVGQRRGLGVSAPHPLYVVRLDPDENAVVLGRGDEVPGDYLRASGTHWAGSRPPASSFEARAMVRYNSRPAPCRVEVTDGGFELRFGERVWALTPGQHAVLYSGDEVLGGGVIESVL
ncbi:MAG: tRNA 2-thiouridine(34) synthase MnmA [Actinomycetota bacterium]|nr:tRNA 2-thiouridine(34) synthase MnmA [Actinomycetota bacterium]